MSDSVVFVTNLSGKNDYSAAWEWGALRPLTSGYVTQFEPAAMIEELASALRESEPEDYLVLSGHSVVAGLAMQLWIVQHGVCNLLLYDQSANSYLKETITMEQLEMAIARAQGNEHVD